MSVLPIFQLAQPVQSVCSLNNFQGEKKIFPNYPPTVPAMFHPANSRYGVKEACKMNVYETSMWILTLGVSMGWQEAQTYSINFLKHAISGDMLPEVSLKLLKNDLKVENPKHRYKIKSTIDSLFPKIGKEKPDKHLSNSGMEEDSSCFGPMSVGRSICSSNGLMNRSAQAKDCTDSTMSVDRSICSLNGLTSRSIQAKEVADSTKTQLVLTLTPENTVPLGQVKYILKNKFAKFGYNVDIFPMSWKHGSYVVVFEDAKLAKEARTKAQAKGYKLSKYRGQRPSPKFLVKYKALVDLPIRTGKSTKQGKTGRKVRKDDVITINQVKGRRARIVSLVNGVQKNIGWVSLHTLTGESLMKRIDY